MPAIVIACLLFLLPVGAGLRAGNLRAVFEGAEAESRWTIQELKLPADWSGYSYLVAELKASSPQRFQLRVHTADGLRSVLMHPFAGARIRAAIPLTAFLSAPTEGSTMSDVGNKSRAGYYIGLWGPQGSLNHVEAVGARMVQPLHSPSLEIYSIRLTKESPGDAVLEPGPLVDEMGQRIGAEWPGKARSVEDLKKDWVREEQSLGKGDFGYCRYGGFRDTQAKATGFFRVEQADGNGGS